MVLRDFQSIVLPLPRCLSDRLETSMRDLTGCPVDRFLKAVLRHALNDTLDEDRVRCEMVQNVISTYRNAHHA
jgi:hypothetical protein